jgi:hypothetical protein
MMLLTICLVLGAILPAAAQLAPETEVFLREAGFDPKSSRVTAVALDVIVFEKEHRVYPGKVEGGSQHACQDEDGQRRSALHCHEKFHSGVSAGSENSFAEGLRCRFSDRSRKDVCRARAQEGVRRIL